MQLIEVEDDGSETLQSEADKSKNEEEWNIESGKSKVIQLELQPVIDVLKKHITHQSTFTRIAILKWIYHLHAKIPNKVAFTSVLSFLRSEI